MTKEIEMHGANEAREAAAKAETQQDVIEQSAADCKAGNANLEADLEFEELDLSVETVEERISPSETNVFDK